MKNAIVKTRLTRSPRIAAHFIRRGEIVAFPTETVYGLGADISNTSAINRIFAAKGRPIDNPLIAHVSSIEQIKLIARVIPPMAAKLIEAFFPGPLTLILPKHKNVPAAATAGLETIGVRMPRHPVAQELIRECGTPLVAPSANLSGRPSPTTWQAVKIDLYGKIGCILKGDQTEIGLESTVVDCSERAPVILRPGAITLEELRAIVPQMKLAQIGDTKAAKSPGLKYRHYAPHAIVKLIEYPREATTEKNAAYIGLDAPPTHLTFRLKRQCRDTAEYAHELFQFFRACDALQVEIIYCQTVSATGLGLALSDRLRRAANP